MHPRARDVGEGRRDDEVDPGTLEVPAEALQDTTGEPAGGRHRDGVDSQLGHCLGNAGERPDDRHRGTSGCGITGRHAGADHLEPGVRLARELADQGVDLLPTADDEHPVRPTARAAAGPVQDLAGRPPADQQQERPDHETHGQDEARQLELRHVAGDRDQAPEVDAGAGDPAVLVAADAEHLAVVGTGEHQHARPAQCQQRTHQDVHREPARPLCDVGEERQSAQQVRQRAAGDHQVAVQQVVADEQCRRERGGDQERVEQQEPTAQAAQPAGVAGDGHAGPGGRSGDLELRARPLALGHYRGHAPPPSRWSTGRDGEPRRPGGLSRVTGSVRRTKPGSRRNVALRPVVPVILCCLASRAHTTDDARDGHWVTSNVCSTPAQEPGRLPS